MTEPAFKMISVEEYLRMERDNPVRHEYVDGFVYAQAGASRPHNIITSNIHVALYHPARKKGCFVFQSDMKVQVTPTRFYYPDLVVGCSNDPDDEYTESKPCLIVEVLSTTTRTEDRVYKAERYRDLPTLQAYLLVDSLSRSAAIYRRTDDGWEFSEIDERVTLPCPEVTLTLDDIYDGVPL